MIWNFSSIELALIHNLIDEEKMKKNKRNHYSGKDKVNIIRQHLLEGVPVSDICDKYNIHPSLYYRWQKQFFEKGAIAFKNTDTKNPEKDKIIKLEQKLQTKNEVLSELMEEHIKLKKSLGEI